MSDASYRDRLARLFEVHNLPLDPEDNAPLRTELNRRRLTEELSDRVDLPDGLSQSVKLLDSAGKIVAWGHAADIRDARLIAFERYLNGEHERYL